VSDESACAACAFRHGFRTATLPGSRMPP
jgi:hypothetical protein